MVGSVTGTATSVAGALAGRLRQLGVRVVTVEDGRTPDEQGPWLICTSTTGAGDIPHTIFPFYQHLITGAYLPGQAFAVVALGDSAYANFAQAGRDIYSALIDCAAQPLADILTIDAIYESNPSAPALEWLETWVDNLNA
jgi:flavodoxin